MESKKVRFKDKRLGRSLVCKVCFWVCLKDVHWHFHLVPPWQVPGMVLCIYTTLLGSWRLASQLVSSKFTLQPRSMCDLCVGPQGCTHTFFGQVIFKKGETSGQRYSKWLSLVGKERLVFLLYSTMLHLQCFEPVFLLWSPLVWHLWLILLSDSWMPWL